MKKLLILLLPILLIGCTTTQEYNLSVDNSSLIQLNDNIYKLNLGGNVLMSESKVKDFALLRVSEIALEKGYKYFEIMENETAEKKIKFNNSSTTRTSGTARTFGNNTNFNATSRTTNNGSDLERYDSEILFKLLDSSNEEGISYNAQMIFDNYASKYLAD
tara:strand:- start:4 stop:486 length:483 start_codon:yes stop_codon:yes gene_type:complete